MSPTPRRVPYRILVIDDSPAALQAVRLLIQMRPKWEICGEATSAADGIAKATTLMPDIIVLDLQMQEMDGFQAAREILRSRPSVPIILFSVFGSPGIVPGALQAGIKRVVAKADGASPLLSAIEELLPQ
jgi:DNA-binding NarL/FixJ family response regulator